VKAQLALLEEQMDEERRSIVAWALDGRAELVAFAADVAAREGVPTDVRMTAHRLVKAWGGRER
jgi:hypothetical protein